MTVRIPQLGDVYTRKADIDHSLVWLKLKVTNVTTDWVVCTILDDDDYPNRIASTTNIELSDLQRQYDLCEFQNMYDLWYKAQQ